MRASVSMAGDALAFLRRRISEIESGQAPHDKPEAGAPSPFSSGSRLKADRPARSDNRLSAPLGAALKREGLPAVSRALESAGQRLCLGVASLDQRLAGGLRRDATPRDPRRHRAGCLRRQRISRSLSSPACLARTIARFFTSPKRAPSATVAFSIARAWRASASIRDGWWSCATSKTEGRPVGRRGRVCAVAASPPFSSNCGARPVST